MNQLERYELGQLLLLKKLITQEQLDTALSLQKQSGKFLGELLVETGALTKEMLIEALTEQKQADFVNISKVRNIQHEIVQSIPETIARKYTLIALAQTDDSLVIAMKDPSDIVAIDAVKRLTGKKVRIFRAAEEEITESIEKFYLQQDDMQESLAALEEVSAERIEEEFDINQLRVAAEDAPIVRFVNSIFVRAVEKRATDIHLEPQEGSIILRFRIDGDLHEIPPPPKPSYGGIVTRLKIIAGVDIGERRLPQDGRMRLRLAGKELDIRLSTLPTIFGEKIVMRLLDKETLTVGMDELGFQINERALFEKELKKPYGMILVTGPTGSGKTTTLYSGLSFINTPDKNITTIEDPVEYELTGINQVLVRPKIGLTFPAILRTLMRQDPDVIMVGEIRDLETAQIAIQASLTGHLVLSTLHTNDTVSTISRLTYMGVEPYLLAASFNLILAQRLIRRICRFCRIEDPEGKELLKKSYPYLPDMPVYRGKGCKECDNSGYYGRTAIYEVLGFTKELRKMIVEARPDDELREYAVKEGMVTLRDSAFQKVLEGITTLQEALSATLSG
jgi:type IV pilus assembly protein PilB